MAVEGTMPEHYQVKYMVTPNGTLDGAPFYEKVSGEGDFLADDDGMGAMFFSRSLPEGETAADTVYQARAMAGGEELSEEIVIHVTQGAASALGGSLGVPEPEPAEAGAARRRSRG